MGVGMLGPLLTRQTYLLDRRLGGSHSHSGHGCKEKNPHALVENKNSALQSTSLRFTD